MAQALSQDFGIRVRRKDIIMKLWLLDEEDDEDDVGSEDGGMGMRLRILDEERWRLSWPEGVDEVED